MSSPTKPSEAKSKAAQKKKRVNGKFVAADPKALEEKKAQLELQRIALEGFNDQDKINEEDREYFGTDSLLFFERALQKAPTWYEAAKYAKELKPIQHPTLASIQSKQELEITAKVLRWQWGEEQEVVETVAQEVIEDKTEE